MTTLIRLLTTTLLIACSGCGGRAWLGHKPSSSDDVTVEQSTEKSAYLPASQPSPESQQTASAKSQKTDSARAGNGEDRSPDAAGFVKRFSHARNFESTSKLDEARVEYQKLIADFPERYEPYHRLGLVADRQRRFREAESLFTEALRRKPMDAEILNDLGYCFYLQGKLEKAESALSKAISLKPSETRFRNNLGLVYGAAGRLEESLETFRHGGSEADAQYNLAFVLAAANDMEEAKRRFRMALAADPRHDGARQALRSFEKADREGDANIDPEFTSDGRPLIPYIEGTTGTSRATMQGRTASDRALQSKGHALAEARAGQSSAK